MSSASASSKWTDLRLASTLWSLVGSQSSAADKPEAASSPAPAKDKDSSKSSKKQRKRHRKRKADATMAAGTQAEAAPELPELNNDREGSDGEDDFGALEMFDSNATQAPYSSQAPEEGSSKKNKRDERDKKRKDKDREVQEASEEPKSSGKHNRRSRKSLHDQGSANGQSLDAEYAVDDEPAETPLSPTKKKRKNSDSTDGKNRKKRKSHSHSTDDGAGATSFLRRRRDEPVDTIQEEPTESDPQQSPSVARVQRRSQSREARSRENSVPAGDSAPDARRGKGTGEASDVDRDVEALAREAWQEHINSQASRRVDAQMTDAPQVDEDNTAQQEPPASAKKARAARQKKAKPTFFEQPMQDEDVYPVDQLPSPSAMTPKPRNRLKRAAPKQPSKRQRRKAEAPLTGADEDDDEDEPNKRSRTHGYTQGKFSEVELSRIAHAVESFRSEHDMPQHQVNDMIQAPGGTAAGEAHAQLWVRIFAECPDRHRQKVINITRKKFHNFVARGTWTLEQDAELSELINTHGPKWSYIAGLVNRHPEDIRDRYRNYLVCGSSQKKEAWDEDEESRLTTYVLNAMRAIDQIRQQQPSRKLLQKTYEELIDWQNISEQMDRTRSRLQCITKWKSMNMKMHSKDKLVSGEPDSQISFRLEKARRQIDDMPEEEKFRLVLAIQGTAAGTEAKISWQKLVDKQFRNKWHRMTQALLWHRLKSSVPDWQKKTVRDCAGYLVERYNQTSELPNVAGEGFDDDEEMGVIASVPVGTRGGQGQDGISSSMVDEADLADDEPKEAEEPEEMQIDPALSEVPRSAKKATPAKRTLNGKRPSSGKRPRKPAEPIEEDAGEAEADDGQDGDGSEIDESRYRTKKKKTLSKFKKGQAKNTDLSSDSVMDDLEDLPSRVAA